MARLLGTRPPRLAALLAGLLLAGAALEPAPASAQRIGVASSVKNQVTGSLGGSVRRLSSGAGVSQNETVSTGAASATQLLFRDQTSLTMGANASLTLTRHVYNPATGAGDVAARVGKGAFRFVSGVAAPGSYRLESPTVTIGIRGSIVEGYVDPDTRQEVYVLVQGTMVVCTAASVCVTVDTPGQYVHIAPDGGITGPTTWRGPLLDLDASVNFVRTVLSNGLETGVDPLPRPQGANETLDGLRIDRRFPPMMDDKYPGGGHYYPGEGGCGEC